MPSLLAELRRRNVFRVAIAYLVFSWLLLQVTDILLPIFGAPDWVQRVLVLLLVVGFIAAAVFSWAYELTPEGLKRESEVDRSRSITDETARKLDIVVILLILVALPLSFIANGVLEDGTDAPPTVEATDSGSGSEVSIAVLPFLDLSPDMDQGHFALGMSEELLNALAKVPGLSVASRTSAFAFGGSDLGAGPIGKALQVGHVLEGSIRKSGDKLRITAQLIDVESDRHLWSETYDRRLEDVFAIQDEITRAIVAALRKPLGITDVDAAVNLAPGTDNMNAYELFLVGREHFIQRNLQQAIPLLERVVALDPDYARGRVLLGATYALAPGWVGGDRPWFELATETLDRAEALDPESSMVHAARGMLLSTQAQSPERWPDALVYLEHALELDPDNASAHLWNGVFWAQGGFFERAREHFRACIRIDPSYFNCKRHLALVLIYEGQTDEAASVIDALMRDHQFTSFGPQIALAYIGTDNESLALFMMNHLLDAIGVDAPGWLRLVRDPDTDPARRELLLRQLLKLQDNPSYTITLSANILLAAIHRPEYIRIGKLEFLWSFMFSESYMQSGRFNDDVRKTGVAYLWDKIGPPPFCQKDGDRYECKLPGTKW